MGRRQSRRAQRSLEREMFGSPPREHKPRPRRVRPRTNQERFGPKCEPGDCWACGNVCEPSGEPWTCNTCGHTYPPVSAETKRAYLADEDPPVAPEAFAIPPDQPVPRSRMSRWNGKGFD